MWGRADSQEVGLEAAILERVRNSSLVKRSCADNSTGLKPGPDAAGVRRCKAPGAVGEHSAIGGRPTGRTAGRGGREDAGTSSDQASENLARRKPKGSWGRFIRPGLVGPKPRPRGVGEGQSVNIPIPPLQRWTDGVTQEGRHRPRLEGRVQARRGGGQGNPVARFRPNLDGWGRPSGHKRAAPTLPRKPSRESQRRPYRKPTQVGEERILRRSGELSRRN